MTLPFLLSFKVMYLLTTAPDRTQDLAFCILLFFCAVGQFLALAELNVANAPNFEWKLLIYALKIIAFVCLFSFAAYTLIATYFFIHPKPH